MKQFVKAIFLVTLTTLLIAIYWLPALQGYWWHWFGALGFVLMGWVYSKAYYPKERIINSKFN